MSEYFKVSICKTACVDNYNEGEVGSMTDFGEIHSFKAKSFAEILNHVDDSDACIFDNRIESSRLENESGIVASNSEVERWKKDEIKLYAVNYSYYISHVIEADLTHDDLIKSFPNLDNQGK